MVVCPVQVGISWITKRSYPVVLFMNLSVFGEIIQLKYEIKLA